LNTHTTTQDATKHDYAQNTPPNYREYQTLNTLRIETQSDGAQKHTLFDLKVASTN
jgi:hypothetical protein